jgi:hypothetical protein
MKVRFKIEFQADKRIVTCPVMPSFIYQGCVDEGMGPAYEAFAAWFERTFETSIYGAEAAQTTHIDVIFRVISIDD